MKIFTLPFSQSTGGFNDEPLQAFIVDKEVIEFSEHFFVHEKTPYLTVVLSYRMIDHDEKTIFNRREDPRKELDEHEKKAYDALRTWRTARSRQEGIPAYLIATNKQLAKMIKLRAKTKASLAGIAGMGEAKIEHYGEDMLKILAKHLLSNPVEKAETEKESKA